MSTEPIDLIAAAALAANASPGPWTLDDIDQCVVDPEGSIVVDKSTWHSSEWFDENGKNDAEFIAQARTLVPALIAEVINWRDRAFINGVAAEQHWDQRRIAEEALADALGRARKAEAKLAAQ